MSEEHHDQELCDRIAIRIFGIEAITVHGKELFPGSPGWRKYIYDYCCNPAANYEMERKMKEKGYGYMYSDLTRRTTFCKDGVESRWIENVENRLLGTAMAADDTICCTGEDPCEEHWNE